MIKLLDFLSSICFMLLVFKYAISSINMMFDLKLRWYFLENIPYLPTILLVLGFIFFVFSEMIKENKSEE
ncbi:epilancin biosynthesis-related protein ElxI1 [Staphylococcus epidermidis]|uniref:epilancin biosynthesis-related protein ElxI1 n=1 Tax=Staphylococcus epidermidis TaxID=1282 RepID=UPI0011A14646